MEIQKGERRGKHGKEAQSETRARNGSENYVTVFHITGNGVSTRWKRVKHSRSERREGLLRFRV